MPLIEIILPQSAQGLRHWEIEEGVQIFMANFSVGVHPLQSLEQGQWVKLICGASYQDLSAIRNLALVYTLAGVDCIDLAADPAVFQVAQEGIKAALALNNSSTLAKSPWLMVSLNDGEDPHFRKAQFNPQLCPADCPRPCAQVCPALAIPAIANDQNSQNIEGVQGEKCYGCGRCIPICPQAIIKTYSHQAKVASLLPWLKSGEIAALEIHTQVGHYQKFQTLWQELQPVFPKLQAIAISCPYHPEAVEYLQSLQTWMGKLNIPLIWQTDGRPMSGDIGRGTTHLCIHYAKKVLEAGLPGFVQLAGGTNGHTVKKLSRLNQNFTDSPENLRGKLPINGVAFGSCARTLLTPVLQELEARQEKTVGSLYLEDYPDLLQTAIALAQTLVQPWKECVPT